MISVLSTMVTMLAMSVRRFTIKQAAAAHPELGERFLRRLVAERRVVFYKVGARVLLDEVDLEALIQAGRVEPRPARPPVRLVTRRARRAS